PFSITVRRQPLKDDFSTRAIEPIAIDDGRILVESAYSNARISRLWFRSNGSDFNKSKAKGFKEFGIGFRIFVDAGSHANWIWKVEAENSSGETTIVHRRRVQRGRCVPHQLKRQFVGKFGRQIKQKVADHSLNYRSESERVF